jgi:Metallo-beta-lactamase superfamily
MLPDRGSHEQEVQVADGVHRLTPGVCNLIEDGGKLALVDAGAPRDWDLLLRTLTALGHGLQDLDAVLITHAHSDHTGFAERARTTADVPVWIHQADAAVAKGAKPAKNDGKARSYLLRVEFYWTLVSLAPGRNQADPHPGGVDLWRRRDAGGAGPTASGACARAYPGSAALLLEGAAGAVERRRVGDPQPADRPGRPADHAVGSEPRHPVGASIPGCPGRHAR